MMVVRMIVAIGGGVKCSDAIGGHIVHLTLSEIMPHTYLDEPQLSLNLSFLHSLTQLQSLDLSSNWLNYLFDPIHGYRSFERLEKLRTLDLSNNYLNNSVLPFLSGAKSLSILNLDSNRLEGAFPPNGLVFPSSLQVLNLDGNQFSITSEGYSKICGLTNLRKLDLSDHNLTSMPYCLGNLTRLRNLDLSNNHLNENLSSFVSGLPSTLEYLSLLNNNFNGSFLFNSLANQTRLTYFLVSSKVGMVQAQAEISSWVPLFQLEALTLQNFILGSAVPGFLVHQHDLSEIDISYNQLTGAFPTWLLENNTRLYAVRMRSNSLTEFQLPMLAHGLQTLDISSNKISDSIQEDIGTVFPELTFMNFSSNHFHGTIPSSMGEIKSLEALDMSSNNLSGKLPKTFPSSCDSLVYLKLSNNRFQGKIFAEHANLTGLEMLLVDGNYFTGIGKGLSKSKNLLVLDMSDNYVSGKLPLWIGTLSSLSYLCMRRNQLIGPFPHQLLHNLPQLRVVDISHNKFSGSIPRNVEFSYLKELRVQSNEFIGTIPESLFESEELQVLNLGSNNFSGKFLNTIGKRSSLWALLLQNNSFQGDIPNKICQLSRVSLLDLSHNKFKGDIPSCLSNMSFRAERYNLYNTTNFSASSPGGQVPSTMVEYLTKSRYEAYEGDIIHNMYGLDLSSNQLSGEIPVEIGDLENIVSLNFSSNHLTGSIPDSISKLKDLESLDLSNNKLDGNIPPQLAGLNNLGYFNVSFNNLSGEIPSKGHLLTFLEMSYIGNTHLCGLAINKSCSPMPEPSASKKAKEEDQEEGDGVIDVEWFYWTCGAVYTSTSLALFAFLCIDSYWSRQWFYRVDLLVHHLQRFKGRSVGN